MCLKSSSKDILGAFFLVKNFKNAGQSGLDELITGTKVSWEQQGRRCLGVFLWGEARQKSLYLHV